MDDHTKNPNSTWREFSDENVRRFLLAQLSGAKQVEFESALFSDRQLQRRVRLAEIELADDYAFNRLTTKQRRLVRQHFLVSGDRRDALEVSTALREQLADISDPFPHGSLFKSRMLFVLRHPAGRFAFASLILVLILAGVWLVTKEPQLVRQIIPRRLRPAAVFVPTPEVANHPRDSGASPTHQDEPSQSPAHEVGVQTFVLGHSSEPATLTVSSSMVSVRFELEVEHPAQSGYRVDLLTGAGEVIYTAPQIFAANGSNRISVDVPASVLKPGDFEVRLTQLADGASVVTYYFHVK